MTLQKPHVHTEQEILNSSFDEGLGVSMVEIIGADGVLQNIGGLNIPAHDYISLGYTGANLTTVVFKTGGSGGTTVATLTLGYDGSNNLTSVTKA